MVGSITLTLRDRGQVKRQNISSQNFIDAKNAIEKKKIKLGEVFNDLSGTLFISCGYNFYNWFWEFFYKKCHNYFNVY